MNEIYVSPKIFPYLRLLPEEVGKPMCLELLQSKMYVPDLLYSQDDPLQQ